jgi:hypothetical protein
MFFPTAELPWISYRNTLEGALAMVDYGGHLLYTFMQDQKKIPENHTTSHYAFAMLPLINCAAEDFPIDGILPLKENSYSVYESRIGIEINVFCVTENIVDYLLKDREKIKRNPLLSQLNVINRMDKGGLLYSLCDYNRHEIFKETCFIIFRSQEYVCFGMLFQLTGSRKRSRSYVNNILIKSGMHQITWKDCKINNHLFSALIVSIQIPKELL